MSAFHVIPLTCILLELEIRHALSTRDGRPRQRRQPLEGHHGRVALWEARRARAGLGLEQRGEIWGRYRGDNRGDVGEIWGSAWSSAEAPGLSLSLSLSLAETLALTLALTPNASPNPSLEQRGCGGA